MLLPMITSLLSGSNSSGGSGLDFSSLFPTKKEKCPIVDLIKEFNGLWEGLDSIGNKRVRAICFMNNLNKFHDHIWSYARTHSTSTNNEDSSILRSSTLDLTSEKLRREINNVMEELSK